MHESNTAGELRDRGPFMCGSDISSLRSKRGSRLGVAWLILVSSVLLHVIDEAATGFLSIYNPTALELRRHAPWLPLPTFTFAFWLSGLAVAIGIAFVVSPIAFRWPRAFRPFAVLSAVLMILNGVNHIVGTILGHTFSDISFASPMPGTYSSPTMIAAAVYVLTVSFQCSNQRLAQNKLA
jgi:hypothetical protein